MCWLRSRVPLLFHGNARTKRIPEIFVFSDGWILPRDRSSVASPYISGRTSRKTASEAALPSPDGEAIPSGLLKLSAVGDDNLGLGRAGPRAEALDLLHHVQAFDDAAEDNVL